MRRGLSRRGVPPFVYLAAFFLALLLLSRFVFDDEFAAELPPSTVESQRISSWIFPDSPQDAAQAQIKSEQKVPSAISSAPQMPNDEDESSIFGAIFDRFKPVQTKRVPAPENAILSPIAVSSPIRIPVAGVMTSGFGFRVHPTSGMRDFHTGIDIACPEGTAISLAFNGVVTEVGFSPIYGNFIVVEHAQNLTTRYCHCSVIGAKVGDVLRAGEYIAQAGSTGTVTGSHLHFEVYINGKICDPLWLMKGD